MVWRAANGNADSAEVLTHILWCWCVLLVLSFLELLGPDFHWSGVPYLCMCPDMEVPPLFRINRVFEEALN